MAWHSKWPQNTVKKKRMGITCARNYVFSEWDVNTRSTIASCRNSSPKYGEEGLHPEHSVCKSESLNKNTPDYTTAANITTTRLAMYQIQWFVCPYKDTMHVLLALMTWLSTVAYYPIKSYHTYEKHMQMMLIAHIWALLQCSQFGHETVGLASIVPRGLIMLLFCQG